MLYAFNNTVLWLPPYMCDLNANELVSGQIRHLGSPNFQEVGRGLSIEEANQSDMKKEHATRED